MIYCPEEVKPHKDILSEVTVDFLERVGTNATISVFLPSPRIDHQAVRYVYDKLVGVWGEKVILDRHNNSIKSLEDGRRIIFHDISNDVPMQVCGRVLTSIFIAKSAIQPMREGDKTTGGDTVNYLLSRLRSPEGEPTKMVVMS